MGRRRKVTLREVKMFVSNMIEVMDNDKPTSTKKELHDELNDIFEGLRALDESLLKDNLDAITQWTEDHMR